MDPQIIKYGNSSYLSNKTVRWFGKDNEQLFLKNRKQLIENNIETDFDYKFNSDSFRNEQLSTQPNIVYLGCSFTLGVGIPVERRWSRLVSDHFNLYENNLAIGGGSNDSAFRLAYYWLPILKPTAVVFHSTIESRIEVLRQKNHSNDQSQHLNLTVSNPRNFDLYKLWLYTDENHHLNRLKNVYALSYYCHSLNIPLLVTKYDLVNWIDKGRDLLHPGVKTNQLIANKVIEKLKCSILS